MSNGLQPFSPGYETLYVHEEVKAVLERKLDPRLIKQRTQGKATLSYIGGHTVIRLLNEAFGYKWSFEIITEEIVKSLPKFNKYAKQGQPQFEDQPPVAKVLGRLTVPGYGVKEQYGSKVLIGGATEQESAFKAASTDAMKKCASLFGIGLELYEGEEEREAYSQVAHAVPQPVEIAQESTPAPITPVAPPKAAQQASAAPVDPNQWQQADIEKLKELKAILGVTHNSQLDSYVREFLDTPDATYMSVSPTNVKAFNIFLSKKAQNM